ncbi:U-box domain-containing protein 13-like [Magnolia sinica]|uniref:U-box domain-containing protein 13-like n=1 Tax=Magnolia sinica TaxID=86752 RepID=UPI0026593C3A|nr:U-box domain-containing protein 13-like [Magnolia sinica]
MSPPSSDITPRTRPPKDFVYTITGQLFSDPVTLETGQTYERRTIQEWLRLGKTTCPINRQLLSATILPKTNYVLKRLIITPWKEQYPDRAQEFSYSETPKSIPKLHIFERIAIEVNPISGHQWDVPNPGLGGSRSFGGSKILGDILSQGIQIDARMLQPDQLLALSITQVEIILELLRSLIGSPESFHHGQLYLGDRGLDLC